MKIIEKKKKKKIEIEIYEKILIAYLQFPYLHLHFGLPQKLLQRVF